MKYIVTLSPGSGIGSALLSILGGLYYLKTLNINYVLNVNQYNASAPVNCFIDFFLDREIIPLLNFVRINRVLNNNNDGFQELFCVTEPAGIYNLIQNPTSFNEIVLLFNNIFILQEKKQIEYDSLPNYDICINIRRGDKITLESHLPIANIKSYIEKIEQINLISPTIFHTSDEYGTFLEIMLEKPDWDLKTLTNPEEKGYFLSELDKQSKRELCLHVHKFMKQLNIMKKSKYFIGTNSTSVGFLVKLLRGVIENESNVYL